MTNIAYADRPSAALAGEYLRHGGKLISTTTPTTLLLVHRTSTTPSKACTYVLLVDPAGKRTYVSSLWDSPTPGCYALEYRGIRYALSMTDSTAVVTPVVTTS